MVQRVACRNRCPESPFLGGLQPGCQVKMDGFQFSHNNPNHEGSPDILGSASNELLLKRARSNLWLGSPQAAKKHRVPNETPLLQKMVSGIALMFSLITANSKVSRANQKNLVVPCSCTPTRAYHTNRGLGRGSSSLGFFLAWAPRRLHPPGTSRNVRLGAVRCLNGSRLSRSYFG